MTEETLLIIIILICVGPLVISKLHKDKIPKSETSGVFCSISFLIGLYAMSHGIYDGGTIFMWLSGLFFYRTYAKNEQEKKERIDNILFKMKNHENKKD